MPEPRRHRLTFFLNTKVGRHTVFLFLLCAVIPVSVIAGVAYLQVSQHLRNETLSRLRDAAKSEGMGILDRLDFSLQEIAQYSVLMPGEIHSLGNDQTESDTEARLVGVALQNMDGTWVPLTDSGVAPPEISQEMAQRLSRGRPVLTTEFRDGFEEVFIGVPVTNGRTGTLWGQVSYDYLWRFVAEGQFGADVCVFGNQGQEMVCTIQDPAPLLQSLAEASATPATIHTSVFQWEYYGEPFLAGHWTMFLNYAFAAPSWTIIRSQSEATALMAMEQFKRTFPLLLLLSIWFVIFISTLQIRRSTEPLEQLTEGTKRLAQRDFSATVTVHSNDEYQDLATSFNSMATHLQNQFETLTALNAVDRAALKGPDINAIIDAGVEHGIKISNAGVVGIALTAHSNDVLGSWDFSSLLNNDFTVSRGSITIGSEEWDLLSAHEDHFTVSLKPPPAWLDVSALNGGRFSDGCIFPIRIHQALVGFLVAGYTSESGIFDGDFDRIRLLADQIALAVSNGRLVEDLDELNWGALTALARTIDAKSPWTRGHSERVTTLGLGLAEMLSLSDKDKELLQRGGLLHDIGKIGVPQEILDKPGKLTAQEMQVMRTHPTLGARILRPIKSYSDIIPIVLYHHEWYDGRGYPEGLAGQNIHYLARVLALPDVYDAVTSPRPYRSSMSHEDAMEIINRGIGTQFDPEFGVVFNAYMGTGQHQTRPTSERASGRWFARDSGETSPSST